MDKELISYLSSTASASKWQKIGFKKRSGLLVPLFSVYSKTSLGIGDAHDLKFLIDFVKETGNSILQLLPLNEIGHTSCPYDSISSFALEPLYLSIFALPDREKKIINKELEEAMQLFVCGKSHVDYRVKEEKLHLLFDIFSSLKHDANVELEEFKRINAYWINDFALFKTIKEYHNGLAWYEWPIELRNRDKKALNSFAQANKEKIEFYIWLQWKLFGQFKSAKEHALKNGVFLKGDLPILVSRDSADVWSHPEYFKLEFAAGAPPDMYCAKGQRWGMPTYNWEKIASDGYKYIKEKLRYAENFYDILRVDHVVGLFRIWSIPYSDPLENQGLNGSFDPWEVNLWEAHGKAILEVMLQSTNMLLCAEDLGVIPKACTDTLKLLGVPGNDVQRWVKDWDSRHDFLKPDEYRKVSVTMLSTHDTTNWPAWWKYEASTVDEALFIRKCNDRLIDFTIIRDKLFDLDLSYHGRLRWKNEVYSVDFFVSCLNRQKQDVADFINIYQNTFQEKEKLWSLLGMNSEMQEEPSPDLVKRVLKFNLSTSAIFSINLITDWLYFSGMFKGDPHQYRINTPGITSEKNWSMTIPMSLDDLLKNRVVREIKDMVVSSGRA